MSVRSALVGCSLVLTALSGCGSGEQSNDSDRGASGSGGTEVTAGGSSGSAAGGTSGRASAGTGGATDTGDAGEPNGTGGGDPDAGGTGTGGTQSSAGGTTGGGAGDSSSSGGSAGSTPASFGANWTGRIGEDGQFGLSFAVSEGGAITDLTLTGSATDCGDTGAVEAAELGPITVDAEGAFQITLVGCGGDSCFTDFVEGTLAPDGTGSGTVTRYGSCSIGGCSMPTGDDTGTPWQAAIDCSLRPTSGVSAERFCDADGNPQPDATGAVPTSIDGQTCSVSPEDPDPDPENALVGMQCAPIGCPAEPCECPEEMPNCDLTQSIFYAPSDACLGSPCVGDWSSTKHCSGPCTTDDDCLNGTRYMSCVIECSNPAVVGLCWPTDSLLWAQCR